MARSLERRNQHLFQAITPVAIVSNALLILYLHLDFTNAGKTIEFSNSTSDSGYFESWAVNEIQGFRSFDELRTLDLAFLACLLILGFELTSSIVKLAGDVLKRSTIPVRGQHLDDFNATDHLFIRLNKAASPPFVYFFVRYMNAAPNTAWYFSDVTVMNTLFPIPLIIIVFDFFYTLLHWALHMRFIYPYIHMHHHRQKAPTRATDDAINVHPIEFFLGEYNHLLAVFIVNHIFGVNIHILCILVLLFMSALLAGLNHTRCNVVVEICGITIFDSKYHDVHHRTPRQNYAQYIPLWDKLFGTFLDYNAKDHVNPRIQLDPDTGKTMTFERAKLISIKVS